MGPVKSVTHSYTWNQYLFWYIEKNDIPGIENALEKKPSLIHERLTFNFKTTPLHRAAVNGNLEVVKLLVQKYKAEVDLKTQGGEIALVGAVKRNQFDVARYLLKMNADADFITDCGLKVIQYAILPGLYEMSLMIYEKMKDKKLRPHAEYTDLGKTYKYRYVNYETFIESLTMQIDPENVRNFLIKQKIVLEDPVIDPRETWKHWFVRNLEFKDPPLVERSELPEDLQPQNRKFGRITHFFSRMMISPLSQKPNFKPQNLTEAGTIDKMHPKIENEIESMKLEVKSTI